MLMAEGLGEKQSHQKLAHSFTGWFLAPFCYLHSASLLTFQKLESFHKSYCSFKNSRVHVFKAVAKSTFVIRSYSLYLSSIAATTPGFPSAKEVPRFKLSSGSCDIKWQDFHENVFSVAEALPLAFFSHCSSVFVQLERSNDLFFQKLII